VEFFMATKFLALLIIVGVMTMMFAAGDTGAGRVTPSTAAPTRAVALTEQATAEATEAATSEATENALVGDPARGEELFRHGLNGVPPCITCHNPTAVGRTGFSLGPGLKGIGERGATRVEGLTAPAYIEDSIRHPANFLVPGFNPIMPVVFGEEYGDQDIADLVAFLMTL
jgi:mono/diheme cytochrome c family protein